MKLDIKEGLASRSVTVSDTFIDKYMPAANGEYVKVFLYMLAHGKDGEMPETSAVADALEMTESDVKRAVSYWEKAGVLNTSEESAVTEDPAPSQNESMERLERLSKDEEFTALIYALQQYLGKTFTHMDSEKFAYLYDGLGMSSDLLEYLAEYCAGAGHTSIRYLEKVALNWHSLGITDREEAKEYTLTYSKDVQAVMRSFGITGRTLAAVEADYLKKWFGEYGFDRKVVTEACSRTIKSTGTASFPYADAILTGWKDEGVKVLADIKELDAKKSDSGVKASAKSSSKPAAAKTSSNRFKNADERDNKDNYEDYIIDKFMTRHKKETDDGAF